MRRTGLVAFQLFSFVFIPPLIYRYFHVSSMSVGVAICFSLLFLNFLSPTKSLKINRSVLISMVFFVFVVLLSSVFAYFKNIAYFNLYRFSGSFLLLLAFLFFSYFYCCSLSCLNGYVLNQAAFIIYIVLFLDGFVSSIQFSFFNYPKSLFFFTEPSHFALTIAPFFIYEIMVNYESKVKMFVYFSSISFVAILLKSLVLVSVVFLGAAIAFKKRYIILSMLLVFFLSILFSTELAYFFERLSFSGNSNNLSVLVYLSGFQRAALSLIDSDGLGLGFQQMGYYGEVGNLMGKVIEIAGFPVNFNDGGTVAAKLVAEFGFFGLFIISIYLFLFAHVLFFVRKFFIHRKTDLKLLNSFDFFMLSAFLAIIISLFVRGTGYFSGATFISLMSFWYILSNKYKI